MLIKPFTYAATALLTLTLFAADSAPVPAPPPAAAPEAPGRECTRLFYAGTLAPLWERFTPEMQKALGSLDKLTAFHAQVGQQLGAETSLVKEKVESVQGWSIYTRLARFEKVPADIIVQWSLDAQGRIGGFFIKPGEAAKKEAPSKYLSYATKTALHLPFKGEWFVYWGGRSLKENYHAASVDQRFAYDLMIRKGGRSHVGGGKLNGDYYAYGQPLFAPAAGTVTEAVDGVADNVPGEMNPGAPAGNHLVIDHGNGEFSLLAHFQPGTLKVKNGDKVAAGQPLGLCGNSGNSSEPHLHYHLQNGPAFGQGEGLPAPFVNYAADGKPAAHGEPVKGQTIRPAAGGK